MTTTHIWEVINSVFPNVTETQVIKDLDTSQKKFARNTGMLTERGLLSSISSNIGWSLPTGFVELTDITMYDSNDSPLYIGDYNYSYEIEFNKLFIYSLTDTPITGISTDVTSIYIHYKKLPSTLASVSTALEIDLEYREALLEDLLSKYFSMYPSNMVIGGQPAMALNLNAASYHRKEYDRIRIEAKKAVNSKDTTFKKVQNYQHAGAYILPKRGDVTAFDSTITTQILALSEIYTKYVRYTLDSSDGDGAVTPSTAAIGYTTVSGTVSSDTFTVTSTNEFENDTHIVPNNEDVTYSQDSDSQLTFNLPSGWGVIDIEIYEI